MKKLFLIFLFIGCIIFFVPGRSIAQFQDITSDQVNVDQLIDSQTPSAGDVIAGEHIRSFSADYLINKDGTVTVEEKIVYDFGDVERHGIYRTIPYISRNQQGKKYKIDLRGFTVEDETGRSYRFSQSVDGEDIKLKIGDPNQTISGIHTYIIKYRVSGGLTYFSDHDEFYWNVTGDQWTVPISQVSATVELAVPDQISGDDIKLACYTGSYGSKQSSCRINYSDFNQKKAVIQSLEPLDPKEGLTVVYSFPINLVARLEAKPVISFWDTIIGKLVGLVIGLLAFFWYVIYPLKIIYRWYRYGRDPKAMIKQVRAWYEPPKAKDGRWLTPGEVGALVDETVNPRDLSGTVVDLAKRGYLKIEERKKNDWYFVKRRAFAEDAGLLPFEKELLKGFFKTSDETRLKDRHLTTTVLETEKKLYDQLVADGLFPKNPNSTRTFYYIIGGLALFTANFLLALVAFVFGRVMPAKSVFGVESANIARSLKNFLTSQKRQLEFQAKNQMFFEKLLPYAAAFGVEKIWAERFKDINLQPPEWYSSYDSTRAFNSVVFANSLNSSMSSFRAAATPVSSTTGHASGFGGGGFSGGGGGGGGGGSW